jgi:hypothetical protein
MEIGEPCSMATAINRGPNTRGLERLERMNKPGFNDAVEGQVEVQTRRSVAPTWLMAVLMSGAACNLTLEPIEGSGGSSVITAGGSEPGSGGSCASGEPAGGSSEYYGGWSAAGGGSEYYGGFSAAGGGSEYYGGRSAGGSSEYYGGWSAAGGGSEYVGGSP